MSDRKPINTGAQLQGTLVSLETGVVEGGQRLQEKSTLNIFGLINSCPYLLLGKCV